MTTETTKETFFYLFNAVFQIEKKFTIISVDPTIIKVFDVLVCYFLHSWGLSLVGNKWPHFGELFFTEDAHKLELRSIIEEGGTNENEKTKKIIDLKGSKTSKAAIYSYIVMLY